MLNRFGIGNDFVRIHDRRFLMLDGIAGTAHGGGTEATRPVNENKVMFIYDFDVIMIIVG